MVDEDGFGLTPHQAKMKKKNQAYQDQHMEPIGENVKVMRHSEKIRVEFRYFSTFGCWQNTQPCAPVV
jgi:hypothetical protein